MIRKDEESKNEFRKIYDFSKSDQHCHCENLMQEQAFRKDEFMSNYSSSSEDEPDYFESFLPVFDMYKNEFENLFAPIERLPDSLTRLKGEFRGFEKGLTIDLIYDVENFFASKTETKVTQLKACPNSFFPILSRNPDDEDYPPTYLTDLEYKKFLKPFNPHNKYFNIRKNGLFFMYDSERKYDFQTNFVINSRLFYTKIFNDRLIKTRQKDIKHSEINLPISLYEPKTLIKRFCDIFVFFPYVFQEFHKNSNKLDEEYVLSKIASAIVTGIHKVFASQGLPLNCLYGETFEIKMNSFYLFAEVRKDNYPTKITYNIRFLDRFIVLNGWVEIWWNYFEIEDSVQINLSSYNKMIINLKEGKEHTYEFIFPKEFLIQGIIEEVVTELVRVMNVSSFFFIRGPSKTLFGLFNSDDDHDLFEKFSRYVEDKLSNIDDIMCDHYCIGVIFPSSLINFSFTPLEPIKKESNNLEPPLQREKRRKKVSFSHINQIKSKMKILHYNEETKSFLKLVEDFELNYKKLFLKLISTKEKIFPTSVFIGSWLDLIFFKYDCLTTKNVKLLQFKNSLSFSTEKEKINLKIEKNCFLHNKDYVELFGKEMWEKVKIPIPLDTRYREDLIWLIRYFRYFKSSGKETVLNNNNINLELDNKKQEALKLATRWKELLEGYNFIFIKKKIST
jgi:hypothetical protein